MDVENRVDLLVEEFDSYVDSFDRDPNLALAQRATHGVTLELRRSADCVRDAIANPQFTSALRETLLSWGLGKRRSRLAPMRDFAAGLHAATPAIAALEPHRIDDVALPADMASRIWQVVETLQVTDNQAKIVAGTKTLHHLLPDLVPPMDRAWTGRFFRVRDPAWQVRQGHAFQRLYDHFVDIARRTNPERYVTGVGWRTSCTKIIDNAIIAYCKGERPGNHTRGRRISFRVLGLPPAKSEAQSLLAPGHPHAARVQRLLEAARAAVDEQGFTPITAGRVGLDLVVRPAPGTRTSDATNYLGGVGDVLEDKAVRGTLGHLGTSATVWLYRNDCQIKQISYHEAVNHLTSYTVTVQALDERS
ncbi:hypothetical protein AOZ06_38950 [Kibdelosporangium phytohabitans]|uniref:Uncharacterized protein n=1 Tax=Kibdelosporangium phytohabitans TaxID=860235 RepID=A0A0N9I141_9PSEU|nr:hypothetical protein AOZ06_38950 [Kibdelosporangium phytohabitans]